MSKPVIVDDVAEGGGKAVEEDENIEDESNSSKKKKTFSKNPFIEIRAVKEKLEFELTTGINIYSSP
jgi:hypothetical protein